MKVYLDCIPCFIRQALQAVRFCTDDVDEQERILRKILEKVLSMSWDITPPEMAHIIHGTIRERFGEDPYKIVKKQSNDVALSLVDWMRDFIGENGLDGAVRLAIAGNIIDFAVVDEVIIGESVKKLVNIKPVVYEIESLESSLRNGGSILYFADNAGEVVFDKVFIEYVRLNYQVKKISFVVKGGPIINDATVQDVEYIGLNGLEDVEILEISNGDDGTGPDRNSDEVKKWIKSHDIVISKGQANYEGLNELSGIFFMLVVKCKLVADDVGTKVGDVVLYHSK